MIVIFFIIVFFIIIFTMCRVLWVNNIQGDWNYKVYNYRFHLTSHNKWDEYNQNDYFEFTDSVYSFNKMVLCFWKWNIKDMVENQELYNMVIKNNDSI